MSQIDWHKLTTNEVMTRLKSSVKGLSSDQAKLCLQEYGANLIDEPDQRSLLAIFFMQFNDFMVLVLLAAAIISGVIGEPQDTIAILVIVSLNAIIGTIQEYRAERAVSALRNMSAPDARVLRNNQITTIATKELVPGDVVILEAGNIVPADLRLLSSSDLAVDESALTGESLTVDKQASNLTGRDISLGDRTNMAFKSSLITRGRAQGIVVGTAMETEIGHIAELIQTEKDRKTPLQIRLTRFGHYLAYSVLLICLVIFVIGLLQGQAFTLMLLTVISLAVAAIPEALPAVVTISLALGARKLIKQNALIRHLPAVETLGSVTFICTDKTGTLSQNKMSAEIFYFANQRSTKLNQPPVSDLDNNAKEIPQPLNSNAFEFGDAIALNNDIEDIDGVATGEPTELALYLAADQSGYIKSELLKQKPRIADLPFDNRRKRMTTIHQMENCQVAYVKGAPESIIANCINDDSSHNDASFDPEQLLIEAENLAQQGYRVIAVAKRQFTELPVPLSESNVENKLTFLGLIGLIDPPRPEAHQAVKDCITAGITPVMITGDHAATAMAMATQLEIAESDNELLTGAKLNGLTDKDFQDIVSDIRVYARVTPEQKIRIVKALQAKGEFVAMTGDGVNDAPALKSAGIGIAMGLKGTDVAREAADMVLLDDNFSTIVQAVRHGRRIFDNIRKFIKYTMSSNSGEIWTLFLAPFFGLPIPLLPIHILWINLITDGLPGLALTVEKEEEGIMQRAPRSPNESIFSHGMWQHMVWVGLLIGGLALLSQAWAISRNFEYWQTIIFTVLTLSQLFHSLAVRAETVSIFSLGLFSNKPMVAALGLTVLLQMAVIYLQPLNEIFHTQPLPLYDLLFCFLISSTVLFAVEIEKWLVRSGLIYAERSKE